MAGDNGRRQFFSEEIAAPVLVERVAVPGAGSSIATGKVGERGGSGRRGR